ncbi:MAG: HlyD family type I secretion periplasmic adaptor subunit [Sphingorhabdus sp.]
MNFMTSIGDPESLPGTEGRPAAIDDDAGRETRYGWIIILAFFGIFLGWALFIRMDAAAYATGSIAVSGNRQVVQHREGGTVAQINVREGQRVKQGQVLIILAGADVVAAERSLASQVIGLQAERARLIAEKNGSATIQLPAEFAILDGADQIEAARAMALQQNTLQARRSTMSSQKSVLGQQSAQSSARIKGIQDQISANRRQTVLFGEELESLRSLAGRGFVSINRIRALERADAALTGDTANLTANIAATREQIGEARMQMLTLDSQNDKDVSESLRAVEFSLNEILPKLNAAKEQLARTMIRAPASGQVVGLKVFTVGGVIAPGDTLLEIVPERVKLVVQAQISPSDADDLYVGQAAEIRIAALQNRSLPVLTGKVTRLSADSFLDERTGQHFFTAEVSADPATLAKFGASVGGGRIKAGLPVEVIVPVRKRTLFQYLIEPLDQTIWRTFREQ